MQARRPYAAGRRGGRLLVWVESLFIMGGTAALVWCVYVLGDAYVAQRLARETLEAMPRTTPSASTGFTASHAPREPARGAPLAELSIPRLGMSAVVLHGSDAHTLRLGLGHIEHTPLPGESGNVAIAGHRDSFFRPLRNVKVGDDILLDTPEERVHYRVASLRIVNSHDVGVIGPTSSATLTLVTCYPFWFIGQAPDRFVVRATRVDDLPLGVTAAAPPVAAKTRRTDGAIQTPAVREAPRDDKALVREAVEHFRLTYNDGVAQRGAGGGASPVAFPFCEVAVDQNAATATCNAAPDAAGLAPPVWTFSLGRTGGEWAITSISMR